jgi:hypothetical protein
MDSPVAAIEDSAIMGMEELAA